jgi:hypothetical protein
VLFLADENMPGAVIGAIRQAGHDVEWVRLKAPGITDTAVLAWAVREDRILLTFDKDFGDLAKASGESGAWGVILFRLPMPGVRDAGRLIAGLIDSRDDWGGHFSVVEPGRIRMRALAAHPAP